MRPQHHHFIFLVFIHARNFGDGVVLHGIVVVKSVGDVQFQRDIFFLLKKPRDARPVFGGQRDLRDVHRLAGLVRSAGLHKHRASARRAAAVVHHRQNFFFGVELVQFFDELLPLHIVGKAKLRALAGNLVLGFFRQFLVASSVYTELRVIGFTSAFAPAITIIPASLPRYLSKSFLSSMVTRTHLPCTTPLVPGVHALA